MSKLPKTRQTDVAVQNLGTQIFVYDARAGKLHHLKGTDAVVYGACLREISFEQLRKESDLSAEAVFAALGELKKENLLERRETDDFNAGVLDGHRVVRKVGFTEWLNLQ